MKLIQGKTVGLAILSYKSPQTLSKTLENYARVHLKEMFDDACVVFQSVGPKDLAVADKWEYRTVASGHYLGVIEDLRLTLENMRTDYILLMENDCPIESNLSERDVRAELEKAVRLLADGEADMVRLRHAWRPGGSSNAAAKYSRYYDVNQLSASWQNAEKLSNSPQWVKKMRRLLFPKEARHSIGRAVYVEENPHLCFPDDIRKVGSFYIVDSAVFPWTNQPSLIPRRFLEQSLVRLSRVQQGLVNMSPDDLERLFNSRRWDSEHFRIAISKGIFTHTLKA
ncbi:hypothetical protein [Akkermansia glycaniphila]|uniref:Nucleotide-diphospho-sugar transferases n=1 Tax=Akkermansia glycaniphila TaxID=1679444 RepID=A0A1C7PBJ6_9BACT|nr:hypothetical protein [Akkermansia glycaniphila]OCA02960.1 hypothetical protein AC781_07510 [Akkermansia glycaniphila]SEH98316.1 Hypothetical protein PYTT_2285 [Akkermansia glycaniphila]